jgi:hypothetical protein
MPVPFTRARMSLEIYLVTDVASLAGGEALMVNTLSYLYCALQFNVIKHRIKQEA